MWRITTATGLFLENGFWFGVGIWGLLVGSAGSLVWTAFSANKLTPLSAVSWESQPPVLPRNDPLQELSSTLPDRRHFIAPRVGQKGQVGPISRGLIPSTPEEMPSVRETPRFVVSSSVTMTGDSVSIEVRLTDPHTKKLISATTLEGRPEDLSAEIRARFRERTLNAGTGAESSAEKAVREAIVKLATWIGEDTPDSVIVKALMTRVKEIPSLQSATLMTVRQGTRLQKIGTEGEWIRIRLASGELGWVYGEVVA